MSAVFACEKTHICPWANPGLLAGRPGSADKKTRVFFCATPGGLSRHVIPALACAVAWDLCLRLVFSVPFPLMGKEPKDQGRHQGPTALGDRSSPMSAGPAHPTQLVFGVPTHYQLLIRQQTTTNDYSRLQTFVQRLSLDRHCIFATQLQKH